MKEVIIVLDKAYQILFVTDIKWLGVTGQDVTFNLFSSGGHVKLV